MDSFLKDNLNSPPEPSRSSFVWGLLGGMASLLLALTIEIRYNFLIFGFYNFFVVALLFVGGYKVGKIIGEKIRGSLPYSLAINFRLPNCVSHVFDRQKSWWHGKCSLINSKLWAVWIILVVAGLGGGIIFVLPFSFAFLGLAFYEWSSREQMFYQIQVWITYVGGIALFVYLAGRLFKLRGSVARCLMGGVIGALGYELIARGVGFIYSKLFYGVLLEDLVGQWFAVFIGFLFGILLVFLPVIGAVYGYRRRNQAPLKQ